MAASPESPEISTEFSTVVENRLSAVSPQMPEAKAGTGRGMGSGGRYHTRLTPGLLTHFGPPSTMSGSAVRSSPVAASLVIHEAHFSAQSQPPPQDARLSRTHEHQERTPGPEAPPRQGAQASHGVLGAAPGEPPAAQELRVSERLQPRERVRKRTDFEHIYAHGAKRHGRFMTMFVLAREAVAESGRSRFGVAATRKLGGAVVRNRAKRLSRELFRRHKPEAGLDVVVVPRREFLAADFPSLERDYVVLLSGHGGRDAGPRRRTDRGAR